jgi:hypothetical protein
MPPFPREGLWEHQYRVIANLEKSLARNDPRALIHMTMGSGKTFTVCNLIYRLVAHGGARRVLFLVDRRTLGRQALNELQQFGIPGDGRKFTESADLDDFVRRYNRANRHERAETERFRGFSYEDLMKRDRANLDIFWLRDDSLGDSSELPDPAVLVAEIVEDLQAALDQFAQIAADLPERENRAAPVKDKTDSAS